MKIISSSPYATFNSKEWDAQISKNDKFANTPIKIHKNHIKTFALKKIKKTKVFKNRSELHEQMQLIFA